MEPLIATRGLKVVPLQADWVAIRLQLNTDVPPREMVFLNAANKAFGGASGVLAIARHYGWASWLWWLGRVPVFMACFDATYRWFAERRHCENGVCAMMPKTQRKVDSFAFVVTMALGMLVGFATWNLAPWAFMWAMAAALAFGLKWLTWRHEHPHAGFRRLLGWFFAWPGMDARAFFTAGRVDVFPPTVREWLFAIAKTLFGIVLLWGLAPQWMPFTQVGAAWLAMVGIIFCLHFGSFHLLSLVWRSCGVNAQPIMHAPVLATSLAEFWGKRWNTAFSIPARKLALIPLGRRIGLPAATMVVFFLSGLLHEVVISLPARGGFGLPTAYFTLQALGMLFERTQPGRRMGLGHGWRGWGFMFLITAGPAFWLFHTAFVHNVILPMLNAIGAT